MKIILKNKYNGNIKNFENKKDLIYYINNYNFRMDYSDSILDKRNKLINKNKLSIDDLCDLLIDYERIKGI